MCSEGECPVCFQTTDEFVYPCQHRLCVDCARSWMRRGNHTCPSCRQVVVRLSNAYDNAPGESVVISNISPRQHLGITLTSSAPQGVLVRQVGRADLAYTAGLRVGDVITHINSIPINEHSVAVAIIETARHNSLPIGFRLRRRKPGLLARIFARMEAVQVM